MYYTVYNIFVILTGKDNKDEMNIMYYRYKESG